MEGLTVLPEAGEHETPASTANQGVCPLGGPTLLSNRNGTPPCPQLTARLHPNSTRIVARGVGWSRYWSSLPT